MSSDRFGGSTDSAGRNVALSWLVVVLLAGLTVRPSLAGSYRWSFLTALSIALVVLPAAASSNPSAMPPWELLVLATVPVVDAAVLDETVVPSVAVYLAVALDRFFAGALFIFGAYLFVYMAYRYEEREGT